MQDGYFLCSSLHIVLIIFCCFLYCLYDIILYIIEDIINENIGVMSMDLRAKGDLL